MSKIDHSINIRYEEDVLVAFDKFIEKWCGGYSGHLLDSDENDGQFMREKITQALADQRTQLIQAVEEKKKPELENYWSDNSLRSSYAQGFIIALDDVIKLIEGKE